MNLAILTILCTLCNNVGAETITGLNKKDREALVAAMNEVRATLAQTQPDVASKVSRANVEEDYKEARTPLKWCEDLQAAAEKQLEAFEVIPDTLSEPNYAERCGVENYECMDVRRIFSTKSGTGKGRESAPGQIKKNLPSLVSEWVADGAAGTKEQAEIMAQLYANFSRLSELYPLFQAAQAKVVNLKGVWIQVHMEVGCAFRLDKNSDNYNYAVLCLLGPKGYYETYSWVGPEYKRWYMPYPAFRGNNILCSIRVKDTCDEFGLINSTNPKSRRIDPPTPAQECRQAELKENDAGWIFHQYYNPLASEQEDHPNVANWTAIVRDCPGVCRELYAVGDGIGLLGREVGGNLSVPSCGRSCGTEGPGRSLITDGCNVQGGGSITVYDDTDFGLSSQSDVTIAPSATFIVNVFSQFEGYALDLNVGKTGNISVQPFNRWFLGGEMVVSGTFISAWNTQIILTNKNNIITVYQGGSINIGFFVYVSQSTACTLNIYNSFTVHDNSRVILDGKLTVRQKGQVEVGAYALIELLSSSYIDTDGKIAMGTSATSILQGLITVHSTAQIEVGNRGVLQVGTTGNIETAGNISIGAGANFTANAGMNLQESGVIILADGSRLILAGNLKLIIPTSIRVGESSRLHMSSEESVTCICTGDIVVEEYTNQEYEYPNVLPDALDKKLFCFPTLTP